MKCERVNDVMKHIVSVDVGFGYVKARCTNGNSVVFSSYIGPAKPRQDLGFGSGNQIANFKDLHEPNEDAEIQEQSIEKNIEVKINGEHYFVGDLSRKELGNESVFEKNRCNDRTLNLIAVAIQLVNPSNDPIYLVTGLPLEQYASDKEEFKNFLDGKKFEVEWITGRHAGKTIHTQIEDTFIYPQGAAAILPNMIQKDGTFKYPEYMSEGFRFSLVDVGFKTTDIITVEVGADDKSFSPVSGMSGTIDNLGMSQLETYMKEYYKSQTTEDMPTHSLDLAMKGKPFPYNKQILNYSQQLEKFKKALAEEIKTEVKNKWRPDEKTLVLVIFSGGGAKDDNFTKHFQDGSFKMEVAVVKNGQHANAVGYLRAAKPYFVRKEQSQASSI